MAQVFAVASLHSTWCSRNSSAFSAADGQLVLGGRRRSERLAAAEAAFAAEVHAAFGGAVDEVHAALVPETRWSGSLLYRLAQAAGRQHDPPVGLYRAQASTELAKWWRQFCAIARAEHLRRLHGPHHVVVRARVDVTFDHPVDLYPLISSLRADWDRAYLQYNGPFDGSYRHVEWNDWVFVTSAEGFKPIANAFVERADGPSAPPITFDPKRRCGGMCSEEQTALLLLRGGLTLQPLPWNLTIRRIYQYAPDEAHAAAASPPPNSSRSWSRYMYERRMTLLRPERGSTECVRRGQASQRGHPDAPWTSIDDDNTTTSLYNLSWSAHRA